MDFKGKLVWVNDESYGHYRDDLSRFWCSCGNLANNYFKDNLPLHQFMCPKCAHEFRKENPDAVEGPRDKDKRSIKVRAINDCVSESYYHRKKKRFRKGNYYTAKSNPIRADRGLTVYLGGLPMCDVGSPFFEQNFEIIK